MNRRQFMQFSLSATTLALFPHLKAMAQHNRHTHHTMYDNIEIATATKLLSPNALPRNLPLAPLTLLTNESQQKNVFRAKLVAKKQQIELVKNQPTEFFSYNGNIPGPLIIANEGDRIELDFHNQLDEPTTVHCHGLPAPSDQDGNPQDPVLPNQSRVYQFTLPKGCAGTYWYHTHAHGLTASQAYKGLAGAIIVKAADDPLAHLPEQHWLISDLRLDQNAQIPGNDVIDWINGREGQFTLINGQHQPQINLTGQERIRIWNACSAKYLHLAIPNCEFIVVGTDGGLLEKPQPAVTQLLIAPAERYEVVVRIKQTGTSQLQNLPYNRGKMFVPYEPTTQLLAQINLTSSQNVELPHQLRQIDDFGEITAKKEVTFVERQHHHIDWQQLSEQQTQDILKNMFLVNGKTYDMQRIDLVSNVNEVEEWSIFNISHMDHPFHIHGTQFIVLEHIFEDKSYQPVKALKDTVNIRPYELVKIKIVQRQKGLRMFHCHILEHENLGMMAQLNVI